MVFHQCPLGACVGGPIVAGLDDQCSLGYSGARCALCHSALGFARKPGAGNRCDVCGKGEGVAAFAAVTSLSVLLVLLVLGCSYHTNRVFLKRVKVLSGVYEGRMGKLVENSSHVTIRKGSLKYEVGSLAQPCQQLAMMQDYQVKITGGRDVKVRGSSLHAHNVLAKGKKYEVQLDQRGRKNEKRKVGAGKGVVGNNVDEVAQIRGSAMVFLSPLHLARQAYVTRITKLKILVQFVQICTRLPSAFRLTYPPFVVQMLTALQVFEIVDIFTIPLKLECWRRLDYIDRTMMHTTACLAVILALQLYISKRPAVRLAASTSALVDARLRRMSSIGRRPSERAVTSIKTGARKNWATLQRYVLNRRRITAANITTLRAKLESLRSQQGRLSAEDLLLLFTYIVYTSICDTLFTFCK
jgi:hypothetical protein